VLSVATSDQPPAPPPGQVPPAGGLIEPHFECQVGATALPPRRSRWDVVNGYLETAAMPEPGDVTYETIAAGMILRAGLTRNISAHVGMIIMDTVHGTYVHPGSAVGGGIKIGGSLASDLKVAVVAEGARNMNLASLHVQDEWIGRAYASVTRGTPLWNFTLTAGVMGTSEGSVRAVSPMFGIGSQLGWDDRLAFVVEAQFFPRAYLGVDSTSVLAVRFRNHDLPRNALRMKQFRVDVGALLIDKADDLHGLPWLQAGLGW
jgi:hypothetical protein